MKNKKVWLVLAVMLMVSFSVKAMEFEGPRRMPTNEPSHMNSGGDTRAETEAFRERQEEQRRLQQAQAAQEALLLKESHVSGATSKEPLTSVPSDQYSGNQSDSVAGQQEDTITSALKAKLKSSIDFTKKASVEDQSMVIAQKQKALDGLEADLKNLEEKETKIGTNHQQIAMQIERLKTRIKELSQKVITPVISPKKKGFFSGLFGKKDTATTSGDQGSGVNNKLAKISWWENRQNNSAATQVLKDPVVAKTTVEGAKALVKSVVVQFKDGKNLSEILNSSSGANDDEQKLIVDAYSALLSKIKVASKVTKAVTDSAKAELEVMNLENVSDQSDFAITIIRQLKAGNSPQQIVLEAKRAFTLLKNGNTVKGKFAERQYTAVVDTILDTLITQKAITPKVQQKLAAQQSAEIESLQIELSKLQKQEKPLADKKENVRLARVKLKEEQATVQRELEAEQVALKLQQDEELKAKQQAEEVARVEALRVQEEKLEQQRQAALELEKAEEAKVQQLAAEVAQVQEAARAAEEARKEAVLKKTFGKMLLEKEAFEKKLALQTEAEAQEVARLQAEQVAPQEAADRAKAEAVSFEAQKKELAADKFISVKKTKKPVEVADNSFEGLQKVKLENLKKALKKYQGEPRKVYDTAGRTTAIQELVVKMNEQASIKTLLEKVSENKRDSIVQEITNRLSTGELPQIVADSLVQLSIIPVDKSSDVNKSNDRQAVEDLVRIIWIEMRNPAVNLLLDDGKQKEQLLNLMAMLKPKVVEPTNKTISVKDKFVDGWNRTKTGVKQAASKANTALKKVLK